MKNNKKNLLDKSLIKEKIGDLLLTINSNNITLNEKTTSFNGASTSLSKSLRELVNFVIELDNQRIRDNLKTVELLNKIYDGLKNSKKEETFLTNTPGWGV